MYATFKMVNNVHCYYFFLFFSFLHMGSMALSAIFHLSGPELLSRGRQKLEPLGKTT